MDTSHHELVTAIQAGDADSLMKYLELRRNDLLAVILSKMGPALQKKVEAEDIFQEVCANAIRSQKEINFTEAGPFGWFCELADRRIIDEQRKFKAQKRDSSKEVGIHAKPNEDVGLVNLLVASITSPSRAFSRQQKEFHLLEAMGQLPKTQQQVLDLRYAKGKSTKQIADEIGKSDGATRVLLTRSLKKLREIMDVEQ
jgi:RNA polymerase sigma-70 factor (ECF subfamily)